jgi:hypothetical protein
MQWFFDHIEELSTIALAIIMLARMVVALTPSKTDDEKVVVVERWTRKILDLLSGAHHTPTLK